MAIKLISAGAGAGKTYKICQTIIEAFKEGYLSHPRELIVTTFTEKAAAELKERVRTCLLDEGLISHAADLDEARIGTVHGLCYGFIQEFNLELGLPVNLSILQEEQGSAMLREGLDNIISDVDYKKLVELEERLSNKTFDGRNKFAETILDIVSKATVNGIGGEQLKYLWEENYQKTYTACGFKVDPIERIKLSVFDIKVTDLLEVAKKCLACATKTTQNYGEALKEIAGQIQDKQLIWSKVRSFLDSEPGKRDLKAGLEGPVNDVKEQFGSDVINIQEFWEDIRDYTRFLFTYAAQVMDAYQQTKADGALIDYQDMEVKMLELLEDKTFQDYFYASFKMILVDEFQDTCPIQLAIFKKMDHENIRTYWVGDIKQSIYGFRGADASLIEEVLFQFQDQMDEENILGTSRRSRKALVEAANALFVPLFGQYPPKLVSLEPHRQEEPKGLQEAFQLVKYAKRTECQAMFHYIKIALDEQWQVYDKHLEIWRAIQPDDICILLPKHNQLLEYGQYFRSKGLPVSPRKQEMSRRKEVILFRALLAWFIDGHDNFSRGITGLFLEDQLDIKSFWQKHLAAEYLRLDDELENRMEELRTNAAYLSGGLMAERLLQAFRLEEWASQQEDAPVRLAGLEFIRDKAIAVANSCEDVGQLSYANRLLKELSEISANDKTPLHSPGLQLMTYHQSKGLEWPLVIMGGMTDYRESGFDDVVVTKAEKFEFENPLGGRSIQKLINPFSANTRNTAYVQALLGYAEDPADEKTRLLYVGFTRARDYLLLMVQEKSNGREDNTWLEKVFQHKGKEMGFLEKQLTGSNIHPAIAFDEEAYPATVSTRPWRKLEIKKVASVPYLLNPSQAAVEDLIWQAELHSLGGRLPLGSVPEAEEADAGNLLHHYMAALGNGIQLKGEAFRSLQASYSLSADFYLSLQEAGERLLQFVGEMGEGKLHTELDIQLQQEDGRLVKGIVDMVYEMEDGLLIIDHKFFPGSPAKLEGHIKDKQYAHQLFHYQQSLEKLFGKKVRSCMLHFPFSGKMAIIKASVGSEQNSEGAMVVYK